MSSTEAPSARPDLSALDPDVQLRIEVAETQGAVWQDSWWADEHMRVLRVPNSHAASVFAWAPALTPDDIREGEDLPFFLTDPAAWGALMERELCGWTTLPDGSEHACLWRDVPGGLLNGGPWAPKLSRAAALAVLAKHGRDTSRYTDGEKR